MTTRTIHLSKRSRTRILHVEAPGCIVNIQIGLTDVEGRPVTRVDVVPDRFAGAPDADGLTGSWELPDLRGDARTDGIGLRVRQVRAKSQRGRK